nr:Gag-Pol polyprotein [Tanacetum cinerariifolium]
MNDLKRNKHFPEKIASNMKFLNNLQSEWSRHATIVHQTKDLHTADYTQLYDFLKYNQKEIAQPGMNMGQDRQIQMVGGNGRNKFRQYVGQNAGNLNGYNAVPNVGNQVAQNPRVQNAKEKGCCLSSDTVIDCSEGRGRNPTLSRRTDSASIYDTDGSAEVHENCDDNDIFNMFIQEEQYTELLEPIPESHQVPPNDNDVISEVTRVEQDVETVEQHSANFEETRALYESLYQNLAV